TVTIDGKVNLAVAVRDYARAFRDYGVDLDAMPVGQAVAHLQTKRALAVPIVAALDDWARSRALVLDQTNWQALVEVARRLDPNPVRDRLRATWGKHVTPELQAELRQLAELMDVQAQGPPTLEVFALTLQQLRLPDAAMRILRDGQYAYPADLWLNLQLGY